MSRPLVLVACEYSGVVRDAFIRAGCDAVSCDLLPTEREGPHVQGDALEFVKQPCDLLIAFPPCTYLCNSGVRWLHTRPERRGQMRAGAAFFRAMLDAPAPRIAVENPVMHRYAREIVGRGPDCTFQPWEHGHGEVKRTCLWLKNLPALRPSQIVSGREPKVHRASPGPGRSKARSLTYAGVAQAMADQWVPLLFGGSDA